MTQLSGQFKGSVGWANWPGRTAILRRLGDVSQLTKPRITAMVAATTLVGFVMGVRSEPGAAVGIGAALQSAWPALVAALTGTALACMSACALNQVIERDVDGKMHRTMDRPLPAARMGVAAATVLGVGLGVIGVLILAGGAGGLSAALALVTILSYVLVYTPLKQRSRKAMLIGAVPGALPPVIGYAAATGRIGVEAVLLGAILMLWQLPHFLAIAWLYRRDYARAHIPVLPVIQPDGVSTFRQILLTCGGLLPLALLPTVLGVSGVTYLCGALVAGMVFLGAAIALAIGKTRRHARVVFFVSLVYLPVVFALMLLDQA